MNLLHRIFIQYILCCIFTLYHIDISIQYNMYNTSILILAIDIYYINKHKRKEVTKQLLLV